MVLTRTHGIDKDLWYRQGLMVLTTPMVLTKTHGIEWVLLNHTHSRGPSVTHMRDFSSSSAILMSHNYARPWIQNIILKENQFLQILLCHFCLFLPKLIEKIYI